MKLDNANGPKLVPITRSDAAPDGPRPGACNDPATLQAGRRRLNGFCIGAGLFAASCAAGGTVAAACYLAPPLAAPFVLFQAPTAAWAAGRWLSRALASACAFDPAHADALRKSSAIFGAALGAALSGVVGFGVAHYAGVVAAVAPAYAFVVVSVGILVGLVVGRCVAARVKIINIKAPPPSCPLPEARLSAMKPSPEPPKQASGAHAAHGRITRAEVAALAKNEKASNEARLALCGPQREAEKNARHARLDAAINRAPSIVSEAAIKQMIDAVIDASCEKPCAAGVIGQKSFVDLGAGAFLLEEDRDKFALRIPSVAVVACFMQRERHGFALVEQTLAPFCVLDLETFIEASRAWTRPRSVPPELVLKRQSLYDVFRAAYNAQASSLDTASFKTWLCVNAMPEDESCVPEFYFEAAALEQARAHLVDLIDADWFYKASLEEMTAEPMTSCGASPASSVTCSATIG